MSILFIIANSESEWIFKKLLLSCSRKKVKFSCFFTGVGVLQLADENLLNLISSAEEHVVCEHSWERYFAEVDSLIVKGSQVDNSRLAACASKVISL